MWWMTDTEVCGEESCGLAAGLDIWELAVLPMLLYNAQCWVEMSNHTKDMLEDLQKQLYRFILAVGSGCPIPPFIGKQEVF